MTTATATPVSERPELRLLTIIARKALRHAR